MRRCNRSAGDDADRAGRQRRRDGHLGQAAVSADAQAVDHVQAVGQVVQVLAVAGDDLVERMAVGAERSGDAVSGQQGQAAVATDEKPERVPEPALAV